MNCVGIGSILKPKPLRFWIAFATPAAYIKGAKGKRDVFLFAGMSFRY